MHEFTHEHSCTETLLFCIITTDTSHYLQNTDHHTQQGVPAPYKLCCMCAIRHSSTHYSPCQTSLIYYSISFMVTFFLMLACQFLSSTSLNYLQSHYRKAGTILQLHVCLLLLCELLNSHPNMGTFGMMHFCYSKSTRDKKSLSLEACVPAVYRGFLSAAEILLLVTLVETTTKCW